MQTNPSYNYVLKCKIATPEYEGKNYKTHINTTTFI